MEVSKFWDETVIDCESGLAARIIVVPIESVGDYARDRLFDVATLLGLTPVAGLVSESEVVSTLGSLVGPPALAGRELASLVARESLVVPGGVFQYTTLAALSYSGAPGAELRLVTNGRHSLLLGISPDYIVVCGETTAVSAILQLGLSERLRGMMGMEGRRYSSAGPAALVQ